MMFITDQTESAAVDHHSVVQVEAAAVGGTWLFGDIICTFYEDEVTDATAEPVCYQRLNSLTKLGAS